MIWKFLEFHQNVLRRRKICRSSLSFQNKSLRKKMTFAFNKNNQTRFWNSSSLPPRIFIAIKCAQRHNNHHHLKKNFFLFFSAKILWNKTQQKSAYNNVFCLDHSLSYMCDVRHVESPNKISFLWKNSMRKQMREKKNKIHKFTLPDGAEKRKMNGHRQDHPYY